MCGRVRLEYWPLTNVLKCEKCNTEGEQLYESARLASEQAAQEKLVVASQRPGDAQATVELSIREGLAKAGGITVTADNANAITRSIMESVFAPSVIWAGWANI